ncbi:hypothetical protein PO909_020706 [Leuciscus waleckii]
MEAGFSDQCLSAGLYQQQDQDKKVVAYASKTLLPPECKFSDCEKALLCTVWAIQRFSNYIGAQKVIIETYHQPVMFLNSQRIRDGVVTNSRIATWLMALQGRNVEARYAQNNKSALGNGLAACQNCSDNSPAATPETPEPQQPQLTCHRYFEKNACEGMPTAYVDGCSYNSEGILKADDSDLRHLHNCRHMLRVRDDILWFVTDDTTPPKLVVPRCQRGAMLMHAHNAVYAGHHGTRATYETLRQVAYWPCMQQDVAEYVRECLVCCQFQPTNLNHRAPLQRRGITFPWTANQKDWDVKLPLVLMAIRATPQESTRVPPFELMTGRQMTLPLHLLYQPGDHNLVTAYTTSQYLDELHKHLVTALMSDMLREISSSMDSLAMGRIPPYLIPLSLVQAVLASATTTPTDPIQTHLAYSLGSAIPLYVDPAQREVGFLLNLPIIESSRIYRLKDVVNIGFWQSNTEFKVRTPEVVAYHDSDPQLYLAPNLHMCTLTKDIHYLCPSKPFLRDNTDGICGLQQLANDARCPADAKPRNQVTETQAEIVGNRWLVNTPARSATLTYDQHDTATRVNLLNQSMWIQVPRGAILHLDDLALYHLPSEEYQAELEIPSFFRDRNFTLDP